MEFVFIPADENNLQRSAAWPLFWLSCNLSLCATLHLMAGQVISVLTNTCLSNPLKRKKKRPRESQSHDANWGGAVSWGERTMPSKTGGRNYFQCEGDGWPDESVHSQEEEAQLQPAMTGMGSFSLRHGHFNHNSSSFEEEQRITPMMSFAAWVCEVTISSRVVNLCGTMFALWSGE